MYNFLTGKFCSFLTVCLKLLIAGVLGYILCLMAISIFPDQVFSILSLMIFIVTTLVGILILYVLIKLMPSIYIAYIPTKPIFVVMFIYIFYQVISGEWADTGLEAITTLSSDWRFFAMIALYAIAVCALCILIDKIRNKLSEKYLLASEQE